MKDFSLQKGVQITGQQLHRGEEEEFDIFREMASARLRDQDRLDGASNYVIWKARISCLLVEHDLKAYVNSVVTGAR